MQIPKKLVDAGHHVYDKAMALYVQTLGTTPGQLNKMVDAVYNRFASMDVNDLADNYSEQLKWAGQFIAEFAVIFRWSGGINGTIQRIVVLHILKLAMKGVQRHHVKSMFAAAHKLAQKLHVIKKTKSLRSNGRSSSSTQKKMKSRELSMAKTKTILKKTASANAVVAKTLGRSLRGGGSSKKKSSRSPSKRKVKSHPATTTTTTTSADRRSAARRYTIAKKRKSLM